MTPAEVVWTYSGVRPLLDDESGNPAAVTRDYRLELDTRGGAPLLSVWGGKITTFRKLAEEAADLLAPALSARLRGAWTAGRAACRAATCARFLGAAAPAASDVVATFERFVARSPSAIRRRRRARAPARARLRHARRAILGRGLGAEVAPGVFEAELAYLRRVEWARTGDDVLWRRSKLGLHLDAGRTRRGRQLDGGRHLPALSAERAAGRA